METVSAPWPSAVAGARDRSKEVHTFLLLMLALLTRLFVVWNTLVKLPAGWLYTRGMEMDALAKSLLAGQGLNSPFGMPSGPTAMIAPAYPVFVAGVFRLFGVESLAATLVILGVHVALNLATVWLILHLGRRFAGEGAAVLVAAFWACSPAVFFMPTILWETSYSAFFLLGAVALALDLDSDSSRGRWVVCGAAVGFAGLFNPALLPSLLALGGWAAYRGGRRVTRKSLTAFVTFLVVFLPWPVRNALVFHAFIPTRTTVGFELWMGNREGASGFLDQTVFPTFNAAELAAYKEQGELHYFAHKEELAKRYIRAHPARFFEMTVVRMKRFWSGTGSSQGSVLFAWHAVTTTLLGFAGLFLMMRSNDPMGRGSVGFLLIPLALFPLPYCITHAEFRYRLVVDPLLCVPATYALSRWVSRNERSSARGTLRGLPS